jgi:peptide/nickel transport system permease protein
MAVQASDPLTGLEGTGANRGSSIDDSPSTLRRVGKTLELWIPVGFLIFLVLACFVWPEIYSVPSPTSGNLGNIMLPPLSKGHLFGTDPLGYDIFSRILYGGRVSLEVGLGSTFVGFIIGGTIGTIAGFKGGVIEVVIMRVLEVFLAFPSLVLAIIVSQYLGPSELHVIYAISFFSIPAFARLARAATLRLKELPYIVAARLSGTKEWRIIYRHLVPNVVPTLMTFALLGVGLAIIVEASLSFLGLGVPPPGPSWGNMIATGEVDLVSSPDLVLIPAAFLLATVVSLNMLGDSLRARWALQ